MFYEVIVLPQSYLVIPFEYLGSANRSHRDTVSRSWKLTHHTSRTFLWPWLWKKWEYGKLLILTRPLQNNALDSKSTSTCSCLYNEPVTDFSECWQSIWTNPVSKILKVAQTYKCACSKQEQAFLLDIWPGWAHLLAQTWVNKCKTLGGHGMFYLSSSKGRNISLKGKQQGLPPRGKKAGICFLMLTSPL